jgi:uncharacterized protein YozE (UPF0346 family)
MKFKLIIGDNEMAKSFYQYFMKYRANEPKEKKAILANAIYDDYSFPKSSKDYHEIATYLELNGDYDADMSVFDDSWMEYTAYVELAYE